MEENKIDLDNYNKIPNSSDLNEYNIFISPIDNISIEIDKNEDNQNKTNNNITLNLNLQKETNFSKKKLIKSKKSSLLIDEKTLVYNLPYFSGDIKSRKNKNYDKISLELNHLFNLWDGKNNFQNSKVTEKTQNNKSKDNMQNDNNNKIQKNNYISKEMNLYYNIFEYINIIQKLPNERTMLDVFIIVNFISNTKLGQYFKDEFDDNKEIYEKLITFCSVEIKYKKYFKGQKIFNIGDLPDFFYIILLGKIDIVKPMQKKIEFTGNEYFFYLMDLKKRGDNYTFNLCIENNTEYYVIVKKDIELIPYIYILINLEKIYIDFPINFSEVLKKVNISPSKLGLTEELSKDNNYIRQNMKKIKDLIPFEISSDLMSKYEFIYDDFLKNEIIIYEDVKFLSLESNDYFGDSALDIRTTRNATIIASEDTDLGYLEMNQYHNNIGIEKGKLIQKKIKFLIKNFFFKDIKRTKFEKKYYGYFISNIYRKGDILFNENEEPLFVFFIEEGRVELSSSKNISEMQNTINALSEKRKKIENKIDLSNNGNINEKNNKNENEEETYKYNKLNNNFNELMKKINKKEKNKFLILKKNEELGIISFYFKIPYLTDCIVCSHKAKIFKINAKYLSEIIHYEPYILYDLNIRIHHKLQLFQERFFNINNAKLLIADRNETNEFEDRIKYQNEIKKNFILNKNGFIINNSNDESSIGNKSKLDIDKFKELLKKISNKSNDNNDETNEGKANVSKNKYNKNVIKLTLPTIKLKRAYKINHNLALNIKKYGKNNNIIRHKNKSLNNHMINIQEIKNNFKNKNRYSIIDYDNSNEKNEKINSIKNINNSLNNSINLSPSKKIKNNSMINNSEIKKRQNNSYINYFKKYFGNNNCLSLKNQIPLIFSKNIFNIDDKNNINNNIKKDNIGYNTNNTYFTTNINSNININTIKNTFLNTSRNNKIFKTKNNINSTSSYKNIYNYKNNISSYKVFNGFKNKNLLKDSNKLSNRIIPNTNTNININVNENINIKDSIINSYVDKSHKSITFNKIRHIDHPYYSPAVLSKKEKYKIFTNDYESYSKKIKNKINIKKEINKFKFKNNGGFSFSSSNLNKNNVTSKKNFFLK